MLLHTTTGRGSHRSSSRDTAEIPAARAAAVWETAAASYEVAAARAAAAVWDRAAVLYELAEARAAAVWERAAVLYALQLWLSSPSAAYMQQKEQKQRQQHVIDSSSRRRGAVAAAAARNIEHRVMVCYRAAAAAATWTAIYRGFVLALLLGALHTEALSRDVVGDVLKCKYGYIHLLEGEAVNAFLAYYMSI